MRIERFYHSAPTAAESTEDVSRLCASSSSAVALIERAFPQGLEISPYALRKRLVCPRWWLVGVMCQWLTKDTEALVVQLGLKEGEYILSGSPLTAKTFPLIVALWTELLSQISVPSFSGTTVELNLSRILRGTVAEMSEQREFVTSYLSSALRIQKLKSVSVKTSSRRGKLHQNSGPCLIPESLGMMQIVENVVLVDALNQNLVVTFSKDPRKLFSDEIADLIPFNLLGERRENFNLSALGAAIVTLQPDVLQAMSRSVSPKKLIPYLSLELMKASHTEVQAEGLQQEGDIWRGRALTCKELPVMHNEQLSRARSFYDHGLLSWENEAPRQRVRALAQKSQGSTANSGIVHCWRLSQHALDAVHFERALSTFLSAEEVVDSTVLPPASTSAPSPILPSRMESAPAAKTLDARNFSINSAASKPIDTKTVIVTPSAARPVEAKRESVPSQVMRPIEAKNCSVPAASQRIITHSPVRETKLSPIWTDDEFLMCVAEFYESLTPTQQQAFERERRRMSPEQFKLYVTPALMRHKARNA